MLHQEGLFQSLFLGSSALFKNFGPFLSEAMGRIPYQTKYLGVLCEVLNKLWISGI